MGLCFLHAMLLPQLPSSGLTEYLIYHHGIPHSISSDQGTHFTANDVQEWAHAHGIYWSYHVPQHPEAAGLIERWNGLLKTQLECQLGGNTLQGWGNVLQEALYAVNQCPLYGAVSPIARIYGSRNQGVEMGVALLTITPSDPVGKFLLPLLATLSSAGLQVLVPKGGVLPPGNTTMIPLNWKLRLPPGHFGLLLPVNQQAKKEITVLAGVIDPDYQGEIGLHLHNGGKEDFAWNTGDPLGRLLVLPCPVIKVNGKLQQPNPSRTNNGPESSGMKVWVTPPGTEPRPAEVLTEGNGNMEWILYQIVPSHKLMLEFHRLLRKSEKEEHHKLGLEVLFAVLDFAGCNKNITAWKYLAKYLRQTLVGNHLAWVQEEWNSRKNWWPNFHFSYFWAKSDWKEDEILACEKALVAGLLLGKGCRYFRYVSKQGHEGFKKKIKQMKKSVKKYSIVNPGL